MKLLLKNIGQLATFEGVAAKHGKQMSDVKLTDDCCILVEDGVVADIFPQRLLPLYKGQGAKEIDCDGGLVTAGYVDCHTHAVFAGDRAQEFNMRLNGATYMQIMNSGGGIINTVTATRNADFDQLYRLTKARVDTALTYGVTTMEIKSGYGLDFSTEKKQLQVVEKLNENHPVDLVATYMGAHATPKGYDTDKYVDMIVKDILPQIKKDTKAEFCDCFCEKGVFDVLQCRRILQRAKETGLKTKVHADEIESIGGVDLACETGATSTEHLLKITDDGISKLAQSNTVGVILPATAFSLKEPQAPARKMIDGGCAVAVATDFNPGSCNCQSIPLVISLACIYCKMTIAETLCALTLNAAAAIDRADSVGTVEKGKKADLIVHTVKNLDQLCYDIAAQTCKTVVKNGKIVYTKQTIK